MKCSGVHTWLGIFLVFLCHNVFAQEPDIESYLTRIDSGQSDQVRAELPLLLEKYPNTSGVLYVQALLTADGAEAARQYQHIVDNYPTSEWADDALYKIHKFYYAIGLYRTAELKWNQLKTNYPGSKYVAGMAASQAEQKAPTPQPPVDNRGGEPKAAEIPTAKETSKAEQPKSRAAADAPKFSLQVGVYASIANAGRQKQFFEYQNYPAEVVSKMKGSQELFYVYVGSFGTTEEAKAKAEEIKKTFNIESLVVTR